MACYYRRTAVEDGSNICLLQKFGAFPDASVCETICKGDPEGYDREQAKQSSIAAMPRCEFLDLKTGECVDPELTTKQCVQLDGTTCRHFVAKTAPCKSCGDKGA